MDGKPVHTTAVKKFPSTRNNLVNGYWKWIEGKRKDDKAEGLWRVHDKLYQLDSFAKRHPGGQYWIDITKGTDITEAFESHHITPKAGDLLQNYYVRDAVDPRNYFFTYDENGFYQTLKRRVAEKLQTIDFSVTKKSRFYHDFALFMMLFAAVMMERSETTHSYVAFALISGQILAWLTNFSLNFIHQADNWRIFTASLSLVSWRDFRVAHVLSHHMYPNTYADYEVATCEPFFKFIPKLTKSWRYIILSILFMPIVYITFFHNMFRYRICGYFWAKDKVFYWDELILLGIPLSMIIFGKEAITWSLIVGVYVRWTQIVFAANFFFGCFYYNRGHHGSDQIHQGDEIKSLDFGEFQLAATVDRREANFNTFTILAYSGEQVLHHLFPSLDSAILPQLKETLQKTCKEFDIDLKPETTMLKEAFGQIKQLYRSEIIRSS